MTQSPHRLALVTGGTSGIGAGAALALAKAGYDVIATGLRAREVATQPAHPSIRHMQLDVTSDASVAAIISACPRLDALVNCAGMIQRGGKEFEIEAFRLTIEVNLTGTMRMCVAARDNIASMMSYFGAPLAPGYAASKGAIAQLTKSLGGAWAKEGIRVNAVAPGWIATELTKPLQEDAARSGTILARTPMERWGTPDDIGGPILFLLSPEARFVTGTILPVDGGYLAV
jgi:NAD(P)-dependent dehydrogenase (short-subunit alcohol dehydrogenase family)